MKIFNKKLLQKNFIIIPKDQKKKSRGSINRLKNLIIQ